MKEKSFSPRKPASATKLNVVADDSDDPTVKSSDFASGSSTSTEPKSNKITSDNEESDIVETFAPAEKAASKNKPPEVPMIAVAENVLGKKCYFRLVQMTMEEVAAIEGTCIPYKLM